MLLCMGTDQWLNYLASKLQTQYAEQILDKIASVINKTLIEGKKRFQVFKYILHEILN